MNLGLGFLSVPPCLPAPLLAFQLLSEHLSFHGCRSQCRTKNTTQMLNVPGGGGQRKGEKHNKRWGEETGEVRGKSRRGSGRLERVHSSYFALLVCLVLVPALCYFNEQTSFAAVRRGRLMILPCRRECRWRDAPLRPHPSLPNPPTPLPFFLLLLSPNEYRELIRKKYKSKNRKEGRKRRKVKGKED